MSTCDILIHTGLVVTQNENRSIVRDASIAVRGGKIVAIGQRESLRHMQAGRVLHLENCLVMPGLVNAHTHAAMTFLRGAADDLPLMEWLTKYIFPVEKHLTAEIVELGTLLGCAEMMRTGTTAFQDMYLIENAVMQAVEQSGMKVRAGEGIFSFPSPAYADEEAAFVLLEEQLARWKDHPRIRLCVTPHSVYTVSGPLLRRSVAFARKHGLPVHIHLAETPAESATCLEANKMRPVAYCEHLDILDANTSIAHGVDLTSAECALLAKHNVTVVHNPKSNMKLASGVAPYECYRMAGLHMALGTDGAASNNTLNMVTEMTACALLHKGFGNDPTIAPAQAVLDAATRNGAQALRWEGLGQLVEGGAADLVAFDLHAPNLQPLFNPVSHLVYAATGHEVCLTMVDGQVLYENGVYTTIDYPALLEEMQTLVRWVQEKSA